MAGGGTGGHVFPIRSLLETLFKTPSYISQVDKIYRFGSRGSLEEEVSTPFHKGGQGGFSEHTHLSPLTKGGVIFQPILS